jgi:peptide/nickel transport system permease protein
MLRYLAGRLAIALAVSLLVLIGLSAVVRFLPGDAATAILRERATPELIERVRDEMGLNDPVPVQVGKFVGNAVTGDLGEDFFTRRPVLDVVTDALPHTIVLAMSSMLVATLLAIPLGVLAATRPGSMLDRFLALTSIVAISIPSLVAGLVLLVVFGVQLEAFPIIGTGRFSDPIDYVHHLVLPTAALALSWVGYLARLLRASLVDALGTTYVRAATAYGVRNRVIFFRYALKNAFIPTLAVVGFGVASLMGGALFVEVIFTRKGVGTVLSRAIATRNYSIVQGMVAIVSVLFIMINLLVDLTYRFVDPRIRVEEASQT